MPKRNAPTPKQMLFVVEYLKDSNGTRAAIAAGYSRKNARQQAYQLLNHQSPVKAAIEEERKKFQTSANYNLTQAMKDADDAYLFAHLTNNANAMVKAAELKAKLNGLLIERHDVRQLGQFSIHMTGFTHGGKSNGKPTKDD